MKRDRRHHTRAAIIGLALGATLPGASSAQPPPVAAGGSAKAETQLPALDLRVGQSVLPARRSQSMLIFTALVADNWDVYTWDFDPAHAPLRRTDSPYDESRPSLAADHSYCVYETVDGKLWRLDLIAQSARPDPLPFASDQQLDMHPAISPDGKHLAVATSLDRTTDDSDLVVYSLDSKKFHDRLELLSYQHYPAWAPDGQLLVFSNLHGRLWTGGPISEIWALRVDTPWARQLTLLDALSITPRWSPDGRRIAFASNREGSFDIWLIDPATRGYSRLTTSPAAETDPVFAPDGKSLIYVTTQSGRVSLQHLDLATSQSKPLHPFSTDLSIPCKDPDWK